VNRQRIIVAAIMLTTLVGLSLSLFIPLLALELERRGVSATMSGINTAFGGIGTLVTVPFVPRLARRFGVPMLIGVSLTVSAIAGVLFYLTPFWMWFPLRFLYGALLGILFTLSEFWITAAAPEERRGLVMGIYATMLSAGFTLGPIILATVGSAGILPYVAGSALYLVAVLPLLLAREDTPGMSGHDAPPVLRIMIAVPVATVAALIFGSIETGGFTLFPVYGLRIGFTEAFATMTIAIVAAGNIVSQVPIGLLSDRVNRPRLLLAIGLLGGAGALLLPLAAADTALFATLLFVWGGITGGLYTVGLAHLGSRFKGGDLVSANAAFVMLYSLGVVVGPPLVGAAIDLGGPHGFAAMLSAMLFAYALLVAVRLAGGTRGTQTP
jgi:MFS family permease